MKIIIVGGVAGGATAAARIRRTEKYVRSWNESAGGYVAR